MVSLTDLNSDHHISWRARLLDTVHAAKTSQAKLTRVIWGRSGPALPITFHILEPGTGYHHIVECIRE